MNKNIEFKTDNEIKELKEQLKYLIRKERVAPLDKEELFELYDINNKIEKLKGGI